MVLKYIVSRLAMFFITIFVASTIIFFLPRLTGQNPLEERFYQEAQRGGFLEDVDEIVAAFEEKYGFDKPLWQQYFTFLGNLTRFDLGKVDLQLAQNSESVASRNNYVDAGTITAYGIYSFWCRNLNGCFDGVET